MTKVRTCPACSDRVSTEDAFCEGCGRPLPEGAENAGHPDSMPTAPQASLAGDVPPGGRSRERADGGARTGEAPGRSGAVPPGADARPGLVPDDGAPTAPQVSLRSLDTGGRDAPPPQALPDAAPHAADSMVTQPIRRDSLPSFASSPPRAAEPEAVPDWPPPATGSNPVRPANPGLCVWCPGEVSDGYCERCGLLQPTGRDHVEVRTRSAVGVSDRGLRHRRNEDAMAIRVIDADHPRAPGVVCAVVCDGVSSSPRSDEASRVTAETGVAVLAERVSQGADPREATGAAMIRAAEAVAGIADSPRSAPACTFVSAVYDPAAGTVTVGWVGDSRAYWLSGGPTSSASALLTRDDSWSEAMVQMGALSREEAMRSSNAHALVAWMGADSGEIDAHISTVTPTGPGAVVLCSDGLWNYFPEAQALTDAVPGAGARPHEAARAYVGLALDAGGKDNITVVIVPVPAGGPRAQHD
ncbi:PP2C family serine/threonine-protein phosphatase [Nocardiopsis sp. HUAS JQ3]|uniref:PP2C family protein-serine/threonine phosphatase n=1 Tax=Nocardiopsis sp. HUAS JQ3 TaxID=3061629 RepID=UPI0023A9D2F3|nr:protein phosphatase 2C domain-containing protein [Nocardiopsis sp. HUAS JQ3]WDZ90512.1 protein phosphatase 2C domain-containing protein [Nocardiopsis sp. HUAS JQ3]